MTEAVPWVKWRFDRWRSDEGLRMCGLSARGLWIELISIMHGCEPYGHLAIKGRAPSTKQIASLVGMTSEREVVTLLQELEDAGVFSRSDDGLIFCRRLVRDNAARAIGKETGSRGGNPALMSNGRKSDNVIGYPPQLTGGVNPTRKPREERREEEIEESPLSPPRATKSTRARSSVVADWGPDDKGVAYANARGVNLNREVPAFRNHHAARGSLMADWSAAWRLWCDNAVKFGQATGKPEPKNASGYLFTPMSGGL